MVSGYAGMLLVTPNYLNEIIKKTTGYSAGYHIRQRVFWKQNGRPLIQIAA
jgi:AraC family transcriptional activator of pobA